MILTDQSMFYALPYECNLSLKDLEDLRDFYQDLAQKNGIKVAQKNAIKFLKKPVEVHSNTKANS